MKNYIKTIIFFFLISVIYKIFASYLLNLLDPSIINSQTEDLSYINQFILTVLIAPALETFIAQVLLYYHLRKIVNEKFCFHLSAIVFALGHYNSVYLVLALVPSGYIYIILFKKLLNFSFLKAFWGVVLTHSMWNFVALIADYYWFK